MDIIRPLNAVICVNCGKKLAEANISEGKLAIKCKCGTVNTIEIKMIQTVKNGSNVR